MPTPRLSTEVARAAGRQTTTTPQSNDPNAWVSGTVSELPEDFGGDYLVALDTGQALPGTNTLMGIWIAKGTRVFTVRTGGRCLIVGLQ